MSYPRQFGNHDSACLASRDPFQRIPEPGPLERSLMLPLMLTDNLQEVQSAPLTLSGDLHRLSSQLHMGALVMLLLHARIPEYTRSGGCWDLVRRRRVSPHEALID
jgi:hypothetical protein